MTTIISFFVFLVLYFLFIFSSNYQKQYFTPFHTSSSAVVLMFVVKSCTSFWIPSRCTISSCKAPTRFLIFCFWFLIFLVSFLVRTFYEPADCGSVIYCWHLLSSWLWNCWTRHSLFAYTLKINSAQTSKARYKLRKAATELGLQRYLSDCGRSQVTTTPSHARNYIQPDWIARRARGAHSSPLQYGFQ